MPIRRAGGGYFLFHNIPDQGDDLAVFRGGSQIKREGKALSAGRREGVAGFAIAADQKLSRGMAVDLFGVLYGDIKLTVGRNNKNAVFLEDIFTKAAGADTGILLHETNLQHTAILHRLTGDMEAVVIRDQIVSKRDPLKRYIFQFDKNRRVHLLTSNNDGESITNFDRITIHKIR
jgi:hypothetical protein